MPRCNCESCQRGRSEFRTEMEDSPGYDSLGNDRQGNYVRAWDRFPFDGPDGRDVLGYNIEGFNSAGYNRAGFDVDGFDANGYDENGQHANGRYRYPCSNCSDRYCGGCEPDYDSDSYDGDSDGLESYSYSPTLVFNGDRAPYYGLEIELTSDKVRRLVETVNRHAGSLVYCKSDSSVEGAELVTHPMSYQWAMEHFPWQMLPALRDEADATVIAQENGIHIHVGRDGFDSPAHLYRWMKLWYRNPADIQRIARRRENHWSSFNPDQRAAQKEHCKYGKPGYKPYDTEYNRTTREYVPVGDATRTTRYAAINTTNDATLEVRVFASTLRPQRAKAALQLVAGSVEYTRQLTAEAITHRRGWDWPAFMAWAGKSGLYPDLLAENRLRRPV
jgi:hypothetical protein